MSDERKVDVLGMAPCPFCGGQAVVGGCQIENKFYVDCAECHCALGKNFDEDNDHAHAFRSVVSAMTAWDRRFGPSVDAIDVLKRLVKWNSNVNGDGNELEEICLSAENALAALGATP